jgi:hypothetical protein
MSLLDTLMYSTKKLMEHVAWFASNEAFAASAVKLFRN